jgi:16S rRNA (adenine1518-N6/adenine1519-N6)-dimethyltransferase
MDAEKPNKFEHKRSLGQNFLTSQVVPGWMVEAAELKAGELVFEIGPGTGMLTKALLEKGAIVIALEADIRAVQELQSTFGKEIKSGQLKLVHGDARELKLAELGLSDKGFKVVANIPYYLSGFLLRQLLESDVQPSLLVFLIQKELATRIVRDPKESLLSLSVKAFGKPSYYKSVGRGHFNPSPKVDSAILKVAEINRENFKNLSAQDFFEILHLGLGKKRKQLLSNLSEKFPRTELENKFNELGIKLNARGEDLDIDTWIKLTNTLIHL